MIMETPRQAAYSRTPEAISRVIKKNIEPAFVYSILKLLQAKYKAGAINGVVLVGNDLEARGFDLETIFRIIDDSLPICDLRNKLDLKTIAWLCEQAKLFIGIDSGLAHVAGAAGCPRLVTWGYDNMGWLPKVPKERLVGFLKKDSQLGKVLEAVNFNIA
jgi:hypothetical protein